jgi:hypothetical protein
MRAPAALDIDDRRRLGARTHSGSQGGATKAVTCTPQRGSIPYLIVEILLVFNRSCLRGFYGLFTYPESPRTRTLYSPPFVVQNWAVLRLRCSTISALDYGHRLCQSRA